MGIILFTKKPVSGVHPVKFGLLYNFYAVSDIRNLLNTGWHVPTRIEFNALRTFCGLDGGKIKETGFIHWNSPNSGATNEYGFNSVGGGYRTQTTGAFTGLKGSNLFWTSTVYSSTRSYYNCELNYASTLFGEGVIHPTRGLSIRPMKDSTILTHGQAGTYTGNDGKLYRTICINGVEYLADNLAETKFRDGSTIPFVGANTINFTNAEWAALITAGCCAFNNDPLNI